jgi:sugar/nucleoside kinase (ribokinase family)
VVKLGSRGSLVKSSGETHRVGIRPTEAVDTTGAGDAYAGGFLYGWCRGWTPDSSAQLGAHVASLTVAQIGAVCREKEALEQARKEIG